MGSAGLAAFGRRARANPGSRDRKPALDVVRFTDRAWAQLAAFDDALRSRPPHYASGGVFVDDNRFDSYLALRIGKPHIFLPARVNEVR